MKRLLPALALLMLAPPAFAAEPIGRLFFTPDQRASLDAARDKRTRTTLSTEETTEKKAPPPPGSEVVTYGGMVRRSDGKTTVWLNNRALNEKDTVAGPMVGRVRPDGSVTLQSPQSGRNLSLKVGERAELVSGRIEEGYSRSPAPKPAARVEAAPAGKPGAAPAAKPAPEVAASAAEADRKKDEREQQLKLEDSLRELRDAANARSGVAPPQPGAAPAQSPPQAMPR